MEVIIMKVISIQIALFFKDLVSRPDYLAEQINQKLGNIFDAMPICMDLPLEAPAEIPVVQRKSTTLPHLLNISRNRSDLTLYPMQENNQLQIIESRYSDDILNYIKTTIQDHEIIRVGIVYTVFQPIDMPCDYISERYFGGNIRGENELSFRMNKIINVRGVNTNNVLNVSNAVANANGKKESGVIYIRDINTVTEGAPKTLSLKQITNILKHSYTILNNESFGEAK